jgi:hypothetical protein
VLKAKAAERGYPDVVDTGQGVTLRSSERTVAPGRWPRHRAGKATTCGLKASRTRRRNGWPRISPVSWPSSNDSIRWRPMATTLARANSSTAWHGYGRCWPTSTDRGSTPRLDDRPGKPLDG